MIKITALAVLLLATGSARAAAVDDAARETAVRAAVENVLTMSDEDYRDLAKSASPDSRWAKLKRPAFLQSSFKGLAASRRRRAAAAGLVAAGREIDADAKAAGPDAELLQETGWGEDLRAYVQSYAPPRPRTPTAVAAVRGGRKLSTDADKEVSRLLAAIDAGDKALSGESLTPEAKGQVHLEAARSYDKLASLIGAPEADTSSNGASREAVLRTAAESALTMSDEDYRDLAKTAAPEAQWAKVERPEFLRDCFESLATSRRNRAIESGYIFTGREINADAKAAGPDAKLLQQTGWADDLRAYANSLNHKFQVRTPSAVAGVRGGRKLSTETDKEVTRLLAAVDEGDKFPSGANHFKAAVAYDKIAALVAPAAAPAPAAAKTMSAKEIYQRAAPSVVLILAAEKEGSGELGTGSIIEGGRVLTNAHVVVNDKTGRPFAAVRVYQKPERLAGDTKRDLKNPIVAKVVRFDRGLDLAILEPETRLKAGPLDLGDDSAVEPGDPVVAIGHPEQGGLWTLTQGVVSTVIADLGGVAGKDAFQTDASINRGNSGGPLIDRSGAIIGVNTSMARKAADGLTITSVNFSVKSSVARRWIGGENAPAAAVAAIAPAAVAAVEPAAAAPAAPAPAIEAPKAPADLPPAPATKPKVLTPQAPYRIVDVIEEEMREMEDLEGEMRREIESRR